MRPNPPPRKDLAMTNARQKKTHPLIERSQREQAKS
jgi:hypothetical protein